MTEDMDKSDRNFLSGTPSRPIEEPIVDCIPLNQRLIDPKEPKAVVKPIELDVSQVLLKLAFGGNQDMEPEEEEEEYDY